MNLPALLTLLFSPSARPLLGVSRTSGSTVYALAVETKNRPIRSIWAGNNLPFWVRCIAPQVLHGDLGNTPVYMTCAPLDGKDDEAWIDANESLVIPQGLAPEQVAVEYAHIGQAMYAATVAKTARDTSAVPPESERPFIALSAPLWNVARLYGEKVRSPFILWRLTSDGSVLGLVRGGLCEKLINCYISRRDFENDPDGSAAIAKEFIRQLIDGESEIPILLYSPEHDFTVPGKGDFHGIAVLRPPVIRDVPVYCHEAFANATAGEHDLNCISFDLLQKARGMEKRDLTARSLVRAGVFTVAALCIILGLSDALFRIIDSRYHGPMERLGEAASIVKAAEKRHGILLQRFREKAHFSTERSRTTLLLSDLQNIFPENVWAESITLTGQEREVYQLDIAGLTTESASIGDALGNLGKLSGISNARLVSSEQVVLPDKTKAVKFSMKAFWRFVEKANK